MAYRMNYSSGSNSAGNPNNNAKGGGYASEAGNPNNNARSGGAPYGKLPNRYAGNAYSGMGGYGKPSGKKGLKAAEDRKARAKLEAGANTLQGYMSKPPSNYDNQPGKSAGRSASYKGTGN